MGRDPVSIRKEISRNKHIGGKRERPVLNYLVPNFVVIS
jgi:hypothetical protein